jgi:small-conductance mechanosensitive channel
MAWSDDTDELESSRTEEIAMLQTLTDLFALPAVRAGAIVLGAILMAYFAERVLHRLLAALAARTATDIDDKIVALVRAPLFLTTIFIGLYWATGTLREELSDAAQTVTYGIILTLAVILWTGAVMRIGTLVLAQLGARARPGSMVQPSTLPLFDILFKIGVMVLAAYFVFLSWRLDLTGWLASAGIIGVAVGFGAKDTLANLFAGIFILADGPYKVGDFIVLEDGLRGRVTGVGMRSTRILTLDHVEITVPNGVIANNRIVNEAGGPEVKYRVPAKVSVAYGSDVDAVRALLLECAQDLAHVSDTPAPEARFTEFGDSGLGFVLLVWVTDPARRDNVLDVLHTRIYKAFGAAGIEIPYSKHDVYIRSMAAALPDAA